MVFVCHEKQLPGVSRGSTHGEANDRWCAFPVLYYKAAGMFIPLQFIYSIVN